VRPLVLLLLVASGCSLGATPVIESCSGSCPAGPCSDEQRCVGALGAGPIQLTPSAPSCAQPLGFYCLTIREAGSTKRYAVQCSPSGQTVTDVTGCAASALMCADGGLVEFDGGPPSACARCGDGAKKVYCVR
jgi:hypothetical protein